MVRFEAQQQIKVTAWQTLVFHMLNITSNTTLMDLCRSVRNAFDEDDLPEGAFRLYVLKHGDLIGDKQRIESEEQFKSLKDVYLKGDPKTCPPTLYVWPIDKSEESPKMLSDRTNKIAPVTIILWGLFPIFSFKLSVLNNIVQIINE